MESENGKDPWDTTPLHLEEARRTFADARSVALKVEDFARDAAEKCAASVAVQIARLEELDGGSGRFKGAIDRVKSQLATLQRLLAEHKRRSGAST